MVQEELGQEDPLPVLRREWEQVRASILKGAEENQVKRNVFVTTIVDTHPSTNGMQCTVEEQLGTHKPHTVLIKKQFSNVIIFITLSNVEWMRRDSCQTILQ